MPSTTAINTFSLRDGVTNAEFEEFSRDVDRPACLAFDQVEAFDVYYVESNSETAVDVVEVMTVTSWADWLALRDGSPTFEPVVRQFERLVDTGTVATIITHRSPLTEEN